MERYGHKIYHVTYVHLPDRSEETVYVYFPIVNGEPNIASPGNKHKDVEELRKILLKKGEKKENLEAVVEYHQKIYFQDPKETKEIRGNRAKSYRKSVLRKAHDDTPDK